MPHYSIFSLNEIRKIKVLLDEKLDKSKAEQLRIRNILRDTFGFYITDFSHTRPYTSKTMDKDIQEGRIIVSRFLPEFDGCYTGWPKDICSMLNISVGQYQRHYINVKVGITYNPRQRFYQHIDRNPEMHWERMIVKYKTSSVENANIVEKWFIENRPELTNLWTGNSPMSGEGPFYVYFLLGDKKL